jgi:F0F1-type ATP synthase epsilon subunit
MVSGLLGLEILSRDSRVAAEVEWVDVASPTGGFVIAPGHAPIVSLLSSNSIISFSRSGHAEHSAPIPGGVLLVDDEGDVTVLLWDE